MAGEQRSQVDIAQAVAIGEQERAGIADPGRQALQPTAGAGLEAGVDEMNEPGLAALAVQGRLLAPEVDGEVAGHGAVMQKVVLEGLGAVSQGER